MTDRRTDDIDRFESALHAWGSRPPQTPAEHAATRVVASLTRRRPTQPWRRPAWVAAAVVLLAVVMWLAPTRQAPRVASNGVAATPIDDNVVLWWLDDETPVYFVLGPAPESKEGRS